MSEAEAAAFLLAEPARTAKLATVRANGRPHVAPVWFDLDEDASIVFMTGEHTVKGRNLARSGWAALCVDDERPPFSFVSVEGPVEMSAEPRALLSWATRIAARYLGASVADAYGRRNAVPGEWLVRIRPETVVSAADVAD
jgi:PPOX class probable F420-dependent enzyme